MRTLLNRLASALYDAGLTCAGDRVVDVLVWLDRPAEHAAAPVASSPAAEACLICRARPRVPEYVACVACLDTEVHA